DSVAHRADVVKLQDVPRAAAKAEIVRSTSSSLVCQLETEMRMARRSSQTVPPNQASPLAWTAATTWSVAASSSSRSSTWFRTTRIRRPGVGAFHACRELTERRRRGRPEAEGSVDVEPRARSRGGVGNRVHVVARARLHLAELCDRERRSRLPSQLPAPWNR